MNSRATTPVDASLLVRTRRSWTRITVFISLIAIPLYLLQRYLLHRSGWASALPLWIAIVTGGGPLLFNLFRQMWLRQFGSDFLAGLSILTATLMGELLVATIIVLMLAGGQALEEYATRRASSVLSALARRMPSVAHRVVGDSTSDMHRGKAEMASSSAALRSHINPGLKCETWAHPRSCTFAKASGSNFSNSSCSIRVPSHRHARFR
jgi:cation transport ATPase